MINRINLFSRVCIGLTGCSIGFATLQANSLLNDVRNMRGKFAAKIGNFASSMFILTGFIGMIHCNWIPLKLAKVTGLVGIVAQISAFFYLK